MKIIADASLPHLTEWFPKPFVLTLFQNEEHLKEMLADHTILLCRSTLKVTKSLLTGSQIACVATASSGIDHIDTDYLLQRKIPWFDAKGCNARAVADYVVACLAVLHQEPFKAGTKAGVIGVGAVGEQVVARLSALECDVICFDPYKDKYDTHHRYTALKELTDCEIISVHANRHATKPYPSVDLIDKAFLAQLKPNTIFINAARGGIVNEDALCKGGYPIRYCTDVYNEEPSINAEIIRLASLCTPHIAGHSIEAKRDAVEIISTKLHNYFQLPKPSLPIPLAEYKPIAEPSQTWQECVLSLYNPRLDTEILKAATDKKAAFLSQRKAHQYRHNFSFYEATITNAQISRLLGHSEAI